MRIPLPDVMINFSALVGLSETALAAIHSPAGLRHALSSLRSVNFSAAPAERIVITPSPLTRNRNDALKSCFIRFVTNETLLMQHFTVLSLAPPQHQLESGAIWIRTRNPFAQQ